MNRMSKEGHGMLDMLHRRLRAALRSRDTAQAMLAERRGVPECLEAVAAAENAAATDAQRLRVVIWRHIHP